MKKAVSFILAILIVSLSLTVGISALPFKASATEIDYRCGDNATWSLDVDTGEFVIEGTGETYSYSSILYIPWRPYSKYIKSITVSEGITVIGNGLLSCNSNAESITLPSTLTRINGVFSSILNLTNIIIPEKNNLKYVQKSFYENSIYYNNIPEGSPVYVGNVLCGWKGEIPENTVLEIREGTTSVMPDAFTDKTNITDIVFPESLRYISADSFRGTSWYENQPDGEIYAANVLYEYKGNFALGEGDYSIADGIVAVGARSFYQKGTMLSLGIPASLEVIGERAFYDCENLEKVVLEAGSKLRDAEAYAFASCDKLESFGFADSENKFDPPESLTVISNYVFNVTNLSGKCLLGKNITEVGISAFNQSGITEVYIPATTKIKSNAFASCKNISKITVEDGHAELINDEYGAVYNKDKTILYYVPSMLESGEYHVAETTKHIESSAFSSTQGIKRVYFNDGLETVDEYLFANSRVGYIDIGSGLKVIPNGFFHNSFSIGSLVIPETVELLDTCSLGHSLSKLVVMSKTVEFGKLVLTGSATYGDHTKIYCFNGSTAHAYAVENGFPYVFMADDGNIGDYSDVEYAIKKANSISRKRQTEYSLSYGNMHAGINGIIWNIHSGCQDEIDLYADEINEYFEKMYIIWTDDFSSLDEAVERANSVDRSLFTDQSLARLDEAVDSAVLPCDVADKYLVEEYVAAIDDAIKLLEEKKGDYSYMISAIEEAAKIDRSLYTDDSLAILDEAVYEAENAEKTDDQSVINAYTERINEALGALKFRSADFTEIIEITKTVNSFDRTLYTPESLAELDEALAAVDYDLTIDKQSQIAEWVSAIETAIENLDYLPADYSSVEEIKSRAEEIDRTFYTPESLAELDEALAAVDYDLTVDKQSQVAEWVSAIETAIENLDYLPADYSSVEEIKSRADEIDRTLYTPESLAELDEALAAVDYDLTVDNQSQIAEWVSAIETAIENLDYLPADYSSVEEIKSRADEIDRTLYTPESLAELDEALAAVDYDLTVDKQSQIEEWASAIETAIKNLDYLPADYSAVDAQLNKVNVLDRRYYSEISLLALDSAVTSVDYTLNITEQEKVNECAKAIADALAKLEYASIVLRHDPCGVIVSATTKEIKPDTVLMVEKVDPSNYEGTNFAVGGSIRSLHFYDINLIFKGEKVQPEGTVTVKIKLADGVNPSKCKVYHVTEDIVNPLVRFASTIDGNYIVFETTHFSEFAVVEVETVLDSIEISQQPDKTDYIAGESLDVNGMKVVAKFSDGTSKEISDYTVGMVNLNTAGKHKVTVYYTFGSITKTAEFEVDVTAKEIKARITENGKPTDAVNKKLGLFSFYSKAAIQLDCNVQNAEGCTIRWSSDNSKVMVDENGRVTCKGVFGAKKANITVEFVDGSGNVVASDTVRVVFYKLSFQLSNAISQAIEIIRRENK